jgi:hypothetical protein
MKMNMTVKVAAFVLATLFDVIQTGSILFVVVSTQGNQDKSLLMLLSAFIGCKLCQGK